MKTTVYFFRHYGFMLFLAMGILASCNSHSKEKTLKNIKKAEAELNEAKVFDVQKGKDLSDAYAAFAAAYPNDSLSASYLFKAGEISMNLQLSEQAIAYFDQARSNYPSFYKAPECLFLKAFVFENQLGNLTEAESCYKEFIASYPNHHLTDDAVASLKYLGKSPEELVRMFQEKNTEL